jgi:hypothetical protein
MVVMHMTRMKEIIKIRFTKQTSGLTEVQFGPVWAENDDDGINDRSKFIHRHYQSVDSVLIFLCSIENFDNKNWQFVEEEKK